MMKPKATKYRKDTAQQSTESEKTTNGAKFSLDSAVFVRWSAFLLAVLVALFVLPILGA